MDSVELQRACVTPYNSEYYRHGRPELVELIPHETRRLLDVGCGTGALGQLAQSERGVTELIGVELEPGIASIAAEHFDEVIIGDVEAVDLDFESGYFDCIVCADVLEHTRRPDAVLRKLHSLLSQEGKLIVSVPNMSHIYVVVKLLLDRFEYKDQGILDRTHLRFFTPRLLDKVLSGTGYRVEIRKLSLSSDLPARLVRGATLGLVRRLVAYQVIAVASKEGAPSPDYRM